MQGDRVHESAVTPLSGGAIVALSVLLGCVPALQPVLLGALHQAGRITTGQIGWIATLEALGMAAGSTVAAAAFEPRRLRMMAVVAMLVVVGANALTLLPSVPAIFLGRMLSGLASGVVLWMLAGMLTRAANPARIFGIYITCQGIITFALTAAMTQWVVPAAGFTGGYGVLIALALLLLVPAAMVPPSYPPLPAAHAAMPTPPGLMGLGGVVCFLAAVFALWIYLPSLAAAQGLPGAEVSHAIGIGMSGQILGGLAAIALAGRVANVLVVLMSAAAGVAVALTVGWVGSVPALYACVLAFAFFWMFAPPFQLPLLLQIDPGGRSALFVSPAQLSGMAAGPGLASLGLALGPQGPAMVAIGLFALAAVLSVLGLARAPRAAVLAMA